MYTKNGILNLTVTNLNKISKGLNGSNHQSLVLVSPSPSKDQAVYSCKIP